MSDEVNIPAYMIGLKDYEIAYLMLLAEKRRKRSHWIKHNHIQDDGLVAA